MSAKNDTKFKRPEEYGPSPDLPVRREVFFRLKLMPASLVQYSVEKVTLEDDQIVERKTVTERDILAITLSKLEDLILREMGR